MNNMPSMSPIQNWYPSRLHTNEQDVWCEWIQLGNIPFTDPFFEETLAKGRSTLVNSSRYRPWSHVDVLRPWSASLPHTSPTAFIFHVSRCGSTLLSQLLGLHPKSISLAEVPFFDDVIRMPYKDAALAGLNVSDMLTAAVAMYGQHRTGDEQHLFIKLDSWHVFFWQQIRALYPDVPFFLLYRRPDQVVQSHRKLRGMHAVPGVIEPAILGFGPKEVPSADLDGYLARVLVRYFSMYLQIVSSDHATILLNYADGPLSLLRSITTRCGVELGDTYLDAVEKRAGFHAKFPAQRFSEQREPLPVASFPAAAQALYDRLERLRLPG